MDITNDPISYNHQGKKFIIDPYKIMWHVECCNKTLGVKLPCNFDPNARWQCLFCKTEHPFPDNMPTISSMTYNLLISNNESPSKCKDQQRLMQQRIDELSKENKYLNDELLRTTSEMNRSKS